MLAICLQRYRDFRQNGIWSWTNRRAFHCHQIYGDGHGNTDAKTMELAHTWTILFGVNVNCYSFANISMGWFRRDSLKWIDLARLRKMSSTRSSRNQTNRPLLLHILSLNILAGYVFLYDTQSHTAYYYSQLLCGMNSGVAVCLPLPANRVHLTLLRLTVI